MFHVSFSTFPSESLELKFQFAIDGIVKIIQSLLGIKNIYAFFFIKVQFYKNSQTTFKLSSIVFRVSRIYRRKAVAKDWFSNSHDDPVLRGKFEFIQQTEYDVTDVETMLDGLNGITSAYHVHMVNIRIHTIAMVERFSPVARKFCRFFLFDSFAHFSDSDRNGPGIPLRSDHALRSLQSPEREHR